MNLKKNHNLPLDKFIDLSLYNKKFGYYMKKNQLLLLIKLGDEIEELALEI